MARTAGDMIVDIFNRAETDVNIMSVNGVTVTSVDDFKADVSNLSADVNVVEVGGVSVASVDDFKADMPTVDLSTIPADVWSYVTRELTVSIGLTAEQEEKLFSIVSVDNKIDILTTKVDLIPDAILDKVI